MNNNAINNLKGDLLQKTEGIIVHGCNCHGVMGSGIAEQIKNKYPKTFLDYEQKCLEYKNNPEKLLGQIVITEIKQDLIIINALTQLNYGRNTSMRYVSYDAVDECFKRIGMFYSAMDSLSENKLSINFPLIGCGLGNGQWSIIKEIIEFRLSHVENKNLYTI